MRDSNNVKMSFLGFQYLKPAVWDSNKVKCFIGFNSWDQQCVILTTLTVFIGFNTSNPHRVVYQGLVFAVTIYGVEKLPSLNYTKKLPLKGGGIGFCPTKRLREGVICFVISGDCFLEGIMGK